MVTEHGTILAEAIFAHILSTERKRTDRSGRPFLLALIELDHPATKGRRWQHALVNHVLEALKTCTRQTDFVGWYKSSAVIGVVFTELNLEKPARDRILSKVQTALQTHLTAVQLGLVALSGHMYPPQDSELADNHRLYPELAQKKSALWCKRGFDILGGVGLLALLAPLFVLIGVAVRLTSQGPILFKQTRVGQFGRPFTFLKFRSMYTDNDASIHEKYMEAFIRQGKAQDDDSEALKQGGLFKLQDPRVTPVGHILRLTSLDELPQLFNVLMGDMSLVGPRPPIPYEVARYALWHKRRVLEVRPGITGLWQVQGRSRTTFDDAVRLDLKYINEWSLWSDVKILIRTPWSVIKCEGAR